MNVFNCVLTYLSLSMCVCMSVYTCMEDENVPFPFSMYALGAVASVQTFFLSFPLCLSAPRAP